MIIQILIHIHVPVLWCVQLKSLNKASWLATMESTTYELNKDVSNKTTID